MKPRVTVIVKLPGHQAEVRQIDPTREAAEAIVGPALCALFEIINRSDERLIMFGVAHEAIAGARFNLAHPGDPLAPVYGPVLWMEADPDGHPRSIRPEGVEAVLALIASISPETDRPDLAN